jgi:hypothetical protein
VLHLQLPGLEHRCSSFYLRLLGLECRGR